jgi:2-(1,2-epoxy-1,2-dihydrophenyl)acetyl-CoA isomerase
MSTVLNQVDGAVATVTLNRPERLNAMSGELADEVLASLDDHAENDQIRVVVLTGAGRAFCAGGDLQQIGSGGGGEPARSFGSSTRSMRRLTSIAELLHTMPKVTIAAVNGPCAGAGLSWACAADLRYASDSAIFTTAFAKAGQPGDYGGTWFLQRLIGAARARELYFRSTRLDAAGALEIGLVNEVVSSESLMSHVGAISIEIAGFAPVAIRLMKASLNDAETAPLGRLLDLEAERFQINMATTDAREAALAFVEKRPPNFTGT